MAAPTVACFIDPHNAFHQRIVQGAARALHARGWHLRLETASEQAHGAHPRLRALLDDGSVDAFIVQGHPLPALGETLRLARRPIVVVTVRPPGWNGHVIGLDEAAVGRMAAKHLLERGCDRIAYVGSAGEMWSDRRCQGAAAAAMAGRRAFHAIDPLARPLRTLAHDPGRVGIVAMNDPTAVAICAAARACGLSVPERLTVVGVDDDAFRCEIADPPLSSVRLPAIGLGMEAAEVLLRRARGAPARGARPHDHLLAPLGVSARESTSPGHERDPVVAATMARISWAWNTAIAIPDLARAVGLSARSLERRFRAALGTSPLAEIQRLRLAHAQELLATTALPVDEVAQRSGFTTAARLCAVFRRGLAISPGAYRRMSQGDNRPSQGGYQQE